MRIFGILMVLACTAAQVVAVPQTLLHLSFEGSQWVEFAQNGAEAYVDYPNLVPGQTGMGASITRPGEYGILAAKGNINKAHGTISFWYKPDASVDFANEEYGFFSNGTMIRNGKNYIDIWSWASNGGRIRIDVDGVADNAYAIAPVTSLVPGQWAHLAFVWDNTSGIWIYINGTLAGQRAVTWNLADYPEMRIGQVVNDQRGAPCAHGIMDEFKIYDQALSAAEVQQDYNGTLNAPNAPQVIPPVVELVKKRLLDVSFDNGFNADAAEGNPVVKLNSGTTQATGFKGQGAVFGNNAYLQYYAGSNILHSAGSLAFWMKTNWEPAGNGFPIGNNINARDTEYEVFLAGSGADRLESRIRNFLNLYWDGGSIYLGIKGQVMKDTWHHYVFTWDTTKRVARIFLDGKDLGISSKLKALDTPFSQLQFGRNWGSINGMLDEVEVYNWPLNHKEVMALYSEDVGMSVDLLDYAVFSGQNNTLRLRFFNNGTNAVSGQSYKLDVVKADGTTVYSTFKVLSAAAGGATSLNVPLNGPVDGLYRLNITTRGVRIRSFEILSMTESELHPAKSVVEPGQEASKTLLQTIDCSQTVAADKYRDDGAVSVVNSSIGSYRQAQNIPNSGFAYRIDTLPAAGEPYWLEITYPDNAQRTFMVAVFQDYNNHIDAKGLDTMGVITGGDHPNTGKMQVKRMLFWPDTKEIMVGVYCFHQYDGDIGPALAKIRIYKADGLLPRRRVANLAGAPEREIGVWQEDPSMPAYAWFSQDRTHPNIDLENFWKEKWLRTVDYLDYSGQNLWHMMLTAYEGDNGLNSNQIATSWRLSNTYLPGWADVGALMLDSLGSVFYVSLNNRISIQGHDGGLQKMIPPQYLRTTDSMRDFLEGDMSDPDHKLIVDCIASDDYYTGSFNPLNPVVQEAFSRQVRAYAQRYGKYAQFKGIDFLETHESSLFFHSLEEGYSDINIEQFEQDTGIDVPDTTDRRRFSARRDWIFANAKQQWIDWRCQKIHTFYKSLAAIVRGYNPDAQLLVCLQVREAFDFVNQTWPEDSGQLAQYWRECGIDFDLFANDSDIVVVQSITPHHSRIMGGETDRYNGFNPETSALVRNHVQRSAFIVLHSNLEFLPFGYEQRIPDYWTSFGSWGGTVNGPIHAFANVVPSQEYVLEYMTDILAHNDAKRIIHGWWGNPDNGNIEEFSRFYAAYRSIPAYDFSDLPGADDPVKVRYCNAGGDAYVYFVNQQPYPVGCMLQMQGDLDLYSTLDGKSFDAVPAGGGKYRVDVPLEPYGVVCLKAEGGTIAPLEVSLAIAPEIRAEIRRKIHDFSIRVENTTAVGEELGRIMGVYQRIMDAYAKGHYAEVQHLMQSFPVYQNPEFPPLPEGGVEPKLYRVSNE